MRLQTREEPKARERTEPAALNGVLAFLARALRAGFETNLRNCLHWASWLITFSALLIMTAVLQPGHVYGWEIDVTRWVQQPELPNWVTWRMSGSLTDPFSEYGGAIVWVAIVLLWYYGRWMDAVLISLMLPLRVLVHFPKALVDRERPSDLFEGIYGRGGGLSFTSGHAEWLITFYGFLAFLALLRFTHPAARALIAGTYIAFLIVASFGRIHDGNHWPLDMVGGWIAGFGLLSGIIWLRRSLTAADSASIISSLLMPFAALRRDA